MRGGDVSLGGTAPCERPCAMYTHAVFVCGPMHRRLHCYAIGVCSLSLFLVGAPPDTARGSDLKVHLAAGRGDQGRVAGHVNHVQRLLQ